MKERDLRENVLDPYIKSTRVVVQGEGKSKQELTDNILEVI